MVDLVKDRSLSIDAGWLHAGDLLIDRLNMSKYSTYSNLLRRAQDSKQTQQDLIAAFSGRSIPVYEPFAFNWIGPLQIVSPTPEFYNAQMERIRRDDIVEMLNERYKRRDSRVMLESIFGKEPEGPSVEETEELGGEPTSPANEVSTVLYLPLLNPMVQKSISCSQRTQALRLWDRLFRHPRMRTIFSTNSIGCSCPTTEVDAT